MTDADRAALLPTASSWWRDHFRDYQPRQADIPWGDGPQLTEEQRRVIGGSIAEFELGERSEGRHLLGYARQHSERSGDSDYLPAMACFIAEENRHARYLARCMAIEGMPIAQKTAADSAFRFARKLARLELSIMVLITAEVVAQVYYRGLRDATASTILRTICKQILQDEKHHIDFQGQRLALLRQRRSRVTIARRRLCHRALMLAAIAVVWKNHRGALRLGGYTLRRFANQCWAKNERMLRIADPAGYAFDTAYATVTT